MEWQAFQIFRIIFIYNDYVKQRVKNSISNQKLGIERSNSRATALIYTFIKCEITSIVIESKTDLSIIHYNCKSTY